MPSIGATGDSNDNVVAQCFFVTLEREVIGRRRFKSRVKARLAIFAWLEGWYERFPGHIRNLEPTVGVGLLGLVAELLQFAGQFAAVQRPRLQR